MKKYKMSIESWWELKEVIDFYDLFFDLKKDLYYYYFVLTFKLEQKFNINFKISLYMCIFINLIIFIYCYIYNIRLLTLCIAIINNYYSIESLIYIKNNLFCLVILYISSFILLYIIDLYNLIIKTKFYDWGFFIVITQIKLYEFINYIINLVLILYIMNISLIDFIEYNFIFTIGFFFTILYAIYNILINKPVGSPFWMNFLYLPYITIFLIFRDFYKEVKIDENMDKERDAENLKIAMNMINAFNWKYFIIEEVFIDKEINIVDKKRKSFKLFIIDWKRTIYIPKYESKFKKYFYFKISFKLKEFIDTYNFDILLKLLVFLCIIINLLLFIFFYKYDIKLFTSCYNFINNFLDIKSLQDFIIDNIIYIYFFIIFMFFFLINLFRIYINSVYDLYEKEKEKEQNLRIEKLNWEKMEEIKKNREKKIIEIEKKLRKKLLMRIVLRVFFLRFFNRIINYIINLIIFLYIMNISLMDYIEYNFIFIIGVFLYSIYSTMHIILKKKVIFNEWIHFLNLPYLDFFFLFFLFIIKSENFCFFLQKRLWYMESPFIIYRNYMIDDHGKEVKDESYLNDQAYITRKRNTNFIEIEPNKWIIN